jgi:hypothetical protein
LLESSDNSELSIIFGPGGVNASDLNGDFHGSEWDQLKDFYRRRFDGGMSQVLAGRISPIGEPTARGGAPRRAEACTAKLPENCATYEAWIATFADLPTFKSVTGHHVLGSGAAPRETATDPKAALEERRPPLIEQAQPYVRTDRFIDGPTEAWVRTNLPANLVATAYQLPSDCADIAVILRHVWLAAHHRVENYSGWVCGSREGLARSGEIREMIVMEVSAYNVDAISNPYTDERGNRILNFGALQSMLHPGDVLVWKHPAVGGAFGGHTHTVMKVTRNSRGEITEITALQGNLPIGKDQAAQMRKEDIEKQNRRPQKERQQTPSVDELRRAPGRRIEVGTLSRQSGQLPDEAHFDGVWTWEKDGTFLVAAGPPAGAPRPAPQARRGQPAIRRLTDWIRPLQQAGVAGSFDPPRPDLEGTFDSALQEARATIESQNTVTDDDARELGRAAGESLRRLTASSGKVTEETLSRPLERLRTQLRALRDASRLPRTREVFNLIDESLQAAARGTAGADSTRTPKRGN